MESTSAFESWFLSSCGLDSTLNLGVDVELTGEVCASPCLAGFDSDSTLTPFLHHVIAFFLDASSAISSCMGVWLCTLLTPFRSSWVVMSDGGCAGACPLPSGLWSLVEARFCAAVIPVDVGAVVVDGVPRP